MRLSKSLGCLALFIITSFGINPTIANDRNNFLQSYSNISNVNSEHVSILYQAERNSSSAGQAVLRQARIMSLDQQKIVRGSCWDYLNAVFRNAGVKRDTIFKATKNGGHYFSTDEIQAGDWLYYINHSYHDIEHSGMFVGWTDQNKKQALILSYAGGNRNKPARYKVYDISHVYNVMRPTFSKYSSSSSIGKNTLKSQDNYKKDVDLHDHRVGNVNQQNSSLVSFIQRYSHISDIKRDYLSILYKAENNSSSAAKKVLQLSRKIVLDASVVLNGDAKMDSVFDECGVVKDVIFKSSYPYGPFYYKYDIKAGDWLSFVNSNSKYKKKSGIFVGWADDKRNKALILDYTGANQVSAERYKTYDMNYVYQVIRPQL